MGGFFSALCRRHPPEWEQVGAGLPAWADKAEYVDPDAPRKIQVFFKLLDGSLTPVQVTHDSTVESAAYLALSKLNKWMSDYRAIYDGKGIQLDIEKSLADQNIVPDSTIVLLLRLRGGGLKMASHVNLYFMPFLNRMGELPFIDEWLESNGLVLSKLGRQTFHKLFEMVSLHHARNECLNGKFTYKQIIYVPSADSYMIHGRVVDFTSDGYKEDIKALAGVLDTVCMIKLESSQEGIAYVAHLLKIMRNIPVGAESSDTFKVFLRNHPCMMSAASRQGLILEVHRHIKFQPQSLQAIMEPFLRRQYTWGHIARSVHDFNAVYYYRWWAYNPGWPTAYYDEEMSWFNFCRNFLSHPNGNQTIQDADLALWCYFGEHLADFLCRLSLTHGFVINVFDKDYFCTHPTKVANYQTTIQYEEDTKQSNTYMAEISLRQRNEDKRKKTQ